MAANSFCIGVDEELGLVEAQSLFRLPRAIDAEAITLARAYAGKEAMPYEGGAFVERDGIGLAIVLIEEAELDAAGELRIEREVGAFAG